MKSVLKQTWWDQNLNSKMDTFLDWVGSSDAESKVYFRNFLKNSNTKFKNCLDVGCGPATEFFGFKKDNINIEYTGVDSSSVLNNINTEKGIPMIQSEAHRIPVDDSSFDLVFSRHVLEHQLNFEPILEEMIRVSSTLATHIFFIKPTQLDQEFIWTKSQQENLYHNRYNINDIKNFLKLNPKVEKFEWNEINDLENILLIWIKKDGK
jgi:ubiquinone/menaquinone biosynthesis C-methylase UbiE